MIIRALECALEDHVLPPSHYLRGFMREFETENLAGKLTLIRNNDRSINLCDSEGNTSLHTAVARKEAGFVEAILTYKDLSIDLQNTAGLTPLLLAALSNRSEIYKTLLRAGASPFFADLQDCTVLIMAAKNGNSELISYTLDQLIFKKLKAEDAPKKSSGLFNCFSGFFEPEKKKEDSDELNNLIVFCDEQKRTFMEYLLRMNLNAFDSFMKRPEIFKAFASKPSTLLKALILTADYKQFNTNLAQLSLTEINLDSVFESKEFQFDPSDPIHCLIRSRQAQLWTFKLLEAGALAHVDNAEILQAAFKTSNSPLMEFLLSLGCKTVDEAGGANIFEFAAAENLPIVFESFPKPGPEVLKKCLIKAVVCNSQEVIDLLQGKFKVFELPGLILLAADESNPNERVFNLIMENSPSTSLADWQQVVWKYASAQQFKKISLLVKAIDNRPFCKELLQFILLAVFRVYANLKIHEATQLNKLRKNIVDTGVNVNVCESDGRLPLLNMIRARDYYAVKMLLSSPTVDVNLMDCENQLPLFIACATNQLQIVKDLLQKGASVTFLSSEQLDYLHDKCANDILKLIST